MEIPFLVIRHLYIKWFRAFWRQSLLTAFYCFEFDKLTLLYVTAIDQLLSKPKPTHFTWKCVQTHCTGKCKLKLVEWDKFWVKHHWQADYMRLSLAYHESTFTGMIPHESCMWYMIPDNTDIYRSCCRKRHFTLQWRHIEHNGVSNHQPHDSLLNRLFRRRTKKTSKLRVTGLCAGGFTGDRWFPYTKGQ